MVVDAVSEVLNIPTTDVHATPHFGARVDARFDSGVAKLVVLLDIDNVLGGDNALLASSTDAVSGTTRFEHGGGAPCEG